jgi:hypothetical protein
MGVTLPSLADREQEGAQPVGAPTVKRRWGWDELMRAAAGAGAFSDSWRRASSAVSSCC